jgi:hemerythrin
MLDYFGRYKPSWLYNLLPYLYAAAGVLTVLLLRNAVALVSGGLLVTAGVMVWSMRRANRASARARSLGGRKSPGVIDIVWSAAYESGNKQIDNQHLALFAVANALMDEIGKGEPAAVVNETLKGLIHDIQVHFRDEERILEQAAPALATAHKAAHFKLLQQARHLSERLSQGTASMSDLAGFVVYDMVANHLAREDKAFMPALKAMRRNQDG